MGSGGAIITAETSGRVALGMELNPAYVDVAIRRWQQFDGRGAVRQHDGIKMRGDGRTFAAVENARGKGASAA